MTVRKWNLLLLFFIIFIYGLGAFLSIGFLQCDEHYQILEFLSHKLYLSPSSDLAWEFNYQIRPWLPIFIYYIISKILLVFLSITPFQLEIAFRLLSTGIAIFSVFHAYQFLQKRNNTFAILLPFFWFLPLMGARISGEAITAFLILYCLLQLDNIDFNKAKPKLIFLLGLIFGVSFHLRYHTGIITFIVFIYLLIQNKDITSNYLILLFSTGLSLFLGLASDYWGYGALTFAPFNYFRENIINDVASNFGVSPWWHYFKFLYEDGPAFVSVPIFLGVLIFIWRKPLHLFTWILIPFFIIHCLIAHKELRFLFPIIPLACIMFLDSLFFLTEKSKRIQFLAGSALIVPNLILIPLTTFKPLEEKVLVYKFLDSNQNIKTLYSFDQSDLRFYEHLKVHYYRMPFEFVIINSNNFSDLPKGIQPIYIYSNNKQTFLDPNIEKHCVLIFESIPKFLSNLSLNLRDKINIQNHRIYKCNFKSQEF